MSLYPVLFHTKTCHFIPLGTQGLHERNGSREREHRARTIAACTTALEFVNKVVFEHLPMKHMQWTTQHPLPDASSDVWVEFCEARRTMSVAALRFWMDQCFHHALPIAVSMMGIKHTGNDDDNYSLEPGGKRSFWFMPFQIGALEGRIMGPNRDMTFVQAVWQMTMEWFYVPKAEVDGRTGMFGTPGGSGRNRGKGSGEAAPWKVEDQPGANVPLVATLFFNKEEILREKGSSYLCSTTPTQARTLESMLEKRARENASSIFNQAQKCTPLCDLISHVCECISYLDTVIVYETCIFLV